MLHDLTFNGLRLLGPDVTTYVITAISGLDAPVIRLGSYSKPGEDGGVVSSQFYDARPITIEGLVLNRDSGAYQAGRRALATAANIRRDTYGYPAPSVLSFTTTDGLALQANVYVKGLQTSLREPTASGVFQLQLLAADPALYSQTLSSTGTITRQVGGGAVFPLTFPITFSGGNPGIGYLPNDGDLGTWPTVYLRGQTTNPRIYSIEAGASVALTYSTVNAYDVITVDMADKTIMLNGTQSLLPYLAEGSRWFAADPGQNPILFTTGSASDTGSMEATARAAYSAI